MPATLTESLATVPGPGSMAKKTSAYDSIRLPADLTRLARVIASARGLSLPEYLVEKLTPIVEAELPEILKQLGYEAGGEDKPKKK